MDVDLVFLALKELKQLVTEQVADSRFVVAGQPILLSELWVRSKIDDLLDDSQYPEDFMKLHLRIERKLRQVDRLGTKVHHALRNRMTVFTCPDAVVVVKDPKLDLGTDFT